MFYDCQDQIAFCKTEYWRVIMHNIEFNEAKQEKIAYGFIHLLRT